MVSRINVLVLCDMNEDDEQASPVTISLNAATYEMDLCKVHLEEVEELLEPFFSHGKRVGRGKRQPRKATVIAPSRPNASDVVAVSQVADVPSDKERRARIRSWAVEQGYEIGVRGRIAQDIVNLYDEAHA